MAGEEKTKTPTRRPGGLWGGGRAWGTGGRRASRRWLGEQGLDDRFDFDVTSLADMLIADVPTLVNEKQGRPVAHAVGVPRSSVVVLRYRIGDVQALEGVFQIAQIRFVVELWKVVADHDQPLRPV